jgi:hypothetical protein
MKQAGIILGTLAVVVGVILGAVYGGRTLWGSAEGESCSENFSCKPGHVCISRKCRMSCKADADCQAGWSCRPTSVSITKGGDARKGFKLDKMNICFSPQAMAPVLERERVQDLVKKRHDVRLQVIVQTVTTGQLTDAQFDAAWARIPEAELAATPVNALAAKVIAIARGR